MNLSTIKKQLKTLSYTIAGLTLGIIIFFPWDNSVEYIVSKALTQMATKNIYGTVRTAEITGLFDKEINLNNAQIELSVAKIDTSEITINPKIIKTIFTLNPSTSIELGRGEIIPITKQKISWSGGSAQIKIKENIAEITEITLYGKTKADGFIHINLNDKKITKANLRLSVTEDLDRAMETISRSGIIPLTKTGNGKWQVKR